MPYRELFYFLVYPLSIIMLLLGFGINAYCRSTLNTYSKVLPKAGLTAAEVAERILAKYGLSGAYGYEHTVQVAHVSGMFTDHYSPKEKTIRLSDNVYSSKSVAAYAVAAHECGHAIQDKEQYMPHIVHQKLASVAKFCSRFGLPIALFGMLMAAELEGDVAFLDKYMLQIMNIGIILYAVGVLFYFVTIPIERDASNRALAILKDEGILDCVELVGAQKSLNAAGLTYLAAAAAWAATFIRLAALRKRKK